MVQAAVPTTLIDRVDRLCCYHGLRSFSGISGVVSLAFSLPLLPRQGVRQSRALDHQDTGYCHDDWLYVAEVWAQPNYQSSQR